MKTGIILLSHGSRLPDAQKTLNELVNQVTLMGHYDTVIGSALQFNQPDLQTAISIMVSEGLKKVVVVPLFLYMGVHMKEDIPKIIQEERQKHPQVQIEIAGNIGADKRLTEILLDRIGEVV